MTDKNQDKNRRINENIETIIKNEFEIADIHKACAEIIKEGHYNHDSKLMKELVDIQHEMIHCLQRPKDDPEAFIDLMNIRAKYFIKMKELLSPKWSV